MTIPVDKSTAFSKLLLSRGHFSYVYVVTEKSVNLNLEVKELFFELLHNITTFRTTRGGYIFICTAFIQASSSVTRIFPDIPSILPVQYLTESKMLYAFGRLHPNILIMSKTSKYIFRCLSASRVIGSG